MVIHQVPLDEDWSSLEAAVTSVKNTGYRFIYALVFSTKTHDDLLTEAYRQGIAGTGVHNWVFGDSFLGALEGRTFEKNSPLHLAYRGSGALEATGGVLGLTNYDAYARKIAELKNSQDLEYMASLIPKYNHSNYASTLNDVPFVFEEQFLTPLTTGFHVFSYEAIIALGLSACSAYGKSESFTGHDHFNEFTQTTFKGVSGRVTFDHATGTRDPSSTLYKVTNYIEQDEIDPETGATVIRYIPTVSDLFLDGVWSSKQSFVFNDGTTNLPVDLAPPVETETVNLGVAIGVAVATSFVLGLLIFLIYERKRKENDSVWKVQKEEIKFGEVPQVIGRGR